MQSKMIPFLFEEQSVRVILIDEKPWWVATDIAEILGYRSAPDMTKMLDEDEADMHVLRIRSENGVEQDRQLTIINESGLYSVIFGSRKPDAKSFKKWVTSEVLPNIRKTGSYHASPPSTPNPMKEDGAVNTYRQRMLVALMQFYRAFDLSHNLWTQQGLLINITALSHEVGIPVPDVALLQRSQQYPLDY